MVTGAAKQAEFATRSGEAATPVRNPAKGPLLDAVILAIGTNDFAQTLFETMHRGLAIRQMVIHRYRAGAPVEPLALESSDGDCGLLHGLVDQYVRRFHPQDPFSQQLKPARERSVAVRAVAADQVRDSEYRDRLFTRPGISSKLSILVRENDHALSVSLYRDSARGIFGEKEVDWLQRSHGLVAAAVQRHYSLRPVERQDDLETILRAFHRLDVDKPLSAREAAVCARIVKGYSNEAIALDLDISFHSVATYRRRAYAKLGVTAQNELFGLLLEAVGGPGWQAA